MLKLLGCISISISNVYMNIRYVCDEDIREKERGYTITACFLLCIYIYIYIFLPSFHHPTVQSINWHKKTIKVMVKYSDYLAGSTTFGLGCICFTVDALKMKPVSKPLLAGCMLFNLGCVFFIKDALNQNFSNLNELE